jgi:hypothetical protein
MYDDRVLDVADITKRHAAFAKRHGEKDISVGEQKENMIRFPCDSAMDPDRLDEVQLEDDLRQELANMSDAAPARTYEIYQ